MAERVGLKVNLVRTVYRWLRTQELRTQRSKTLFATAGFAALRLLNSSERDEVFRWAKLVDEGQITWEDFEKAADQDQKQRAKALERQLGLALEREAATGQARSAKQA